MICTECNKEQGDDFRKNRNVCRLCDNKKVREYNKTLKTKEKPPYIICKKCNQQKTEFRINRKTCLDCERAAGRKYRKETDTAKIWTENNKERMAELQHNWYEKEKQNIIEKRKEKIKTDPLFRNAVAHRAAVSRIIGNRSKTSKNVNCDSTRLKHWIQFQFTEMLKFNMNFDNYGKLWVIDHVIPIDTYLKGKYDSDVILNWLNIQPVLKKDNLVKNKFIDKNQCNHHLENIKKYIDLCKIEKDTKYINILEDILRS